MRYKTGFWEATEVKCKGVVQREVSTTKIYNYYKTIPSFPNELAYSRVITQ